MTDLSRMIAVKPIISYPRKAQVGKTYLMTIDLQTEDGFEWQYKEEEYPIYCTVNSNLFSSKSIGEPVVVLHRFGGSYGEARFLLRAIHEASNGELSIALTNKWGVIITKPIKLLSKVLPLGLLESFQQFVQRMKDSRQSAEWLLDNRGELVELSIKQSLSRYSGSLSADNSLTLKEKEQQLYYDIDKYIDWLRDSLRKGEPKSLPRIKTILYSGVYITVFEFIKQEATRRLPNNLYEELEIYLDYLISSFHKAPPS